MFLHNNFRTLMSSILETKIKKKSYILSFIVDEEESSQMYICVEEMHR